MRRSHKVDNLQALSQDMPTKPTVAQSLLAHPNGIKGEEETNDSFSEVTYSTDEELDVDVSIDDGTDEPISQSELNRIQKEALQQRKKINISKSAPIAIPTPKTTPATDSDLRGFSIFTADRRLMENDQLAAVTNKKVESAKLK